MSDRASPMTTAKARLTVPEKQANHIKSEKKRRIAIRHAFDRIADVVPGMKGLGRSEAVVLAATVDYVQDMQAKKRRIEKAALAKGITQSQIDDIFSVIERDVRIHEAKVTKQREKHSAELEAAELAQAGLETDQMIQPARPRSRARAASPGAARTP